MTTNQQAGSVLDGKYEVLDHLGGGGMGEVYLVRHIHLEEKRVVKILRADRVGDPDAQKRFLREARFATQIKHANVAILYDYSRLRDGSFYMVWEHIDGEDLGTRVRRDGPLPVTVAIGLGIQALRGLNAIHGAGMIHRDISPDNLMISPSSRGEPHLKIIDLGLAKGLEPDPEHEVTQDGVFMGKLLYCAPEQAGLHKGETLDNRTDLYSMALVLYEMLTGLPPFESETPQGAIFKRLSEDPLPLVDRNPEHPIPEELEQVVLRGLARERDDRYPDAVSFIEALEAFQERRDAIAAGKPPPTRRPPASGRGRDGGSRELSHEEKAELLAQIEAAARRRRKSRPPSPSPSQPEPQTEPQPELKQRKATPEQRMAEIKSALETTRARIDDGRTDEARETLDRARALAAETGARPDEVPEIDRLARQIAHAERTAERRARVEEAAALVERYLKTQQTRLARLALETLVELAPNHPKRHEYQKWIGMVEEEAEQERRAEELLGSARQSLREDDFRGARRTLGQIEKLAPELAATLREEITAAESERDKTVDFEEHRDRLEELIEARDLEAAQAELKTLADLGAAKVTLDLYRARLAEARNSAVGEAQAEVFREAFRERLEQEDFGGARAVAGELQRTVPDSPYVEEMFAEVTRLEQERDRRRSVEQGEAQVEQFIDEGDAGKAELALKLLLQMAPEHKKRKAFEKKIAKLKK
ncbi:MAG: protein kinase [Acidobacteriota bacterium]